MKRIGVTIGKFMPLHKGHELMIQFGSKMLDELYVIVSNKTNSVYSLNQCYEWVKEFVENEKLCNVTVLRHIDDSPDPIDIDEYGTVLDKEFQDYWKNEFSNMVPNATHFVSSDRYGKTMASLLNILWLPVDPDREMVNISATKIRDDMFENFEYLSDAAKPNFIKKVVIVGAESTGKSTLAKHMAHIFDCGYANEYGRTLSVSLNNNMNIQDFIDIMNGQNVLIDIAKKKTRKPLIISDTEAFTTYLYGKKYLDETITSILDEGINQEFDLYVILAPTVNWINDGTRVMSHQLDREKFHNELVDFCKTYNKKYVVIDDTNFNTRTQTTKLEIMKLFV